MPEFKPYVPADSKEPEFTLKAVLVGILLAAVFGAANAYLGMKAGEHWDYLRDYFHKFDFAIAIVLVAGAAWFIWSRWKNRIKEVPSS